MYINKENFLKLMKKEKINEFSIKIGGKINDYWLRPSDKNGQFDNNLRHDLYHSISKEDLEDLLTYLNYNPNNKLGGFFKIDKSIPDNDRRSHLYKEVLI